MAHTSKTQIEHIKAAIAGMSGDERKWYLTGLRDGADVAQIICDETKKFSLASDKTFQAFLNYLDSES